MLFLFFIQTAGGHRITTYILVSRSGVWKTILSGTFNSLVFHMDDFTVSENCLFHHPTAACKSQCKRKLFSTLMDKICLSEEYVCITQYQNMLSFPFLDLFFYMERTTSIASYDGKRKEIKKGGKESKNCHGWEKKNVSFGKTKTNCKEQGKNEWQISKCNVMGMVT